ncbi:MAG: TonB-dependent receptor [Acidobacteriota bacterium]
MKRTTSSPALDRAAVFLLLAALAGGRGALGQNTSAWLRGVVKDANGPISGAAIVAKDEASGFKTAAAAGSDGTFQLALEPGTYEVAVTSEAYTPPSRRLQVHVGQDILMVCVLSPSELVLEGVDTRNPELATQVTTREIENLPQDSRNVLNFAALAPGIRISADPLTKTFAAAAQPAEQTNVYIDGVSFKNDILPGGAVGQFSSRGSLFPQNAVQELRVVTQNYSAEYGKASSAILSAVTKSGGNDLKGEVFWFYQPSSWVADAPKPFQYSTLTSNVDYKRSQPGVSVGGPILRDKLHYFFSYEAVDEQATTPVAIGNPSFQSEFGHYVGVFDSPFKSNLAFGKLSFQPAQNQLFDASVNYRREHETRDFGNTTSFESATDLKNWVYGATLRHGWNSDKAVNHGSLSYQTYAWNPEPLNPTLVGRNYEGVIRIGGGSTTQKLEQRKIGLRDDYSKALEWHGDHNVQVGGNLDFLNYKINRSQNGNPQFDYRNDPARGFTFAQPYEAIFGFGDPTQNISNSQYGLYGQDTWLVDSHLTLTLGLRWDYESDQFDAGYVTPAAIATGLAGKVDPSYISNGHNRSQFTGAIQPRLGFSYDAKGDGRSVIFGGLGRYYDRLFLSATLDERFRLGFPVYRIAFSPDGRPGTIQWNDSYLTKAGLDELIANGTANPEIYLLNNNTKPPYSDQWSLGFRQQLGDWLGSLSYSNSRGHHGFTWLSATGLCCSSLVPGYGNVILSDPRGKEYWYEGLFLTLDRPFKGKWGARFAWTHAKAEQNGNDLFSLDYPSASQYPRRAVPGSEKDRIVATGMVALPWDLRLSTNISLGTGGATDVLDFSQGFDLPARQQTHPFGRSIYPQKSGGFADRTVDFRLQKDFRIHDDWTIGVTGEIFNAFNWATYGCLNNFIPPGGNPTFGQASCTTNLPRRYQVGARVSF